jgi:thiamine biosynthesis lipoprotein
VLVQGTGPAGSAPVAVERVKRLLLDWHSQFSRFETSSELSRLNRDPRERVPVSPMMGRFVEAAMHAATITGGLVDPTLVDEVERAGYSEHFAYPRVAPEDATRLTPRPRPAAPNPASVWRRVTVDGRTGTVVRPVGVRLDSGGIAKGLFGDVLASALAWHEAFAVEAAGDIRVGGAGGVVRAVEVASPFDAATVLHSFDHVSGAVATSGITNRSWVDDRGRLAHHLLDPATGEPAFTGVVQATALAPSGVEAEALAKAALLSGRKHAASWLLHGGVLVHDDGTCDVLESGAPEAR